MTNFHGMTKVKIYSKMKSSMSMKLLNFLVLTHGTGDQPAAILLTRIHPVGVVKSGPGNQSVYNSNDLAGIRIPVFGQCLLSNAMSVILDLQSIQTRKIINGEHPSIQFFSAPTRGGVITRPGENVDAPRIEHGTSAFAA